MAVDKRNLRRAALLRRETVPAAQRQADDHARADLVLARLTSPPSTVAAYLSSDHEPGTEGIIQALQAVGVTVLVPVLRNEPDWVVYEGGHGLRTGRWGIPEAAGEPLGASALRDAGAILVPGLLGTARGVRLGRGGGWYDRALRYAAPGAPRWLLLDDAEVVGELPCEPHDLGVTAIVTPARWVDCGE